MAADFTYTFDGIFYRVIPVGGSQGAISTWNNSPTMHNGMTPAEFATFRHGARMNGYSIRKARPARMSTKAMDKLCRELGI